MISALSFIFLTVCVLTSNLAVDPPEGSFSHAVEFNKDLSDPAWVQGEDKLLLQLSNVHTR